MPDAPMEFVDAHAHHWRPSVHAWYPELRTMPGLDHDYLPADYRADAVGYDVTGLVHVSAVTAPRTHLEETRWLDGMHRESGWPTAVIGTVDPRATIETIEADLLAQAESPVFRGVRVLSGLDPSARRTMEMLRLLAEGGWVYDLVTHPDDLADHLPMVERADSVSFVLEHAGWPDADDPDHFDHWRRGLVSLAAFGNVRCKISGLPMALGTMETERLRPWVEACLEVFGVDRCIFGSNFPVDGMYGSYGRLLGAYRAITDSSSDEDRRRLFVENARTVYGL